MEAATGDQQQNPHSKPTTLNTVEDWLSHAQDLVPQALTQAQQVKTFTVRWKMIISKLEKLPARLSDLSSHPCFSKNTLCKEQLQSVVNTLTEVIRLADLCIHSKFEGKLRMQSDLDSVSGKLDLNLQDCGLLIKTGVLTDTTTTTCTTTTTTTTTPAANSSSSASSSSSCATSSAEKWEEENNNNNSSTNNNNNNNIRELLARLQIGHLESKHRALDTLLDIMKEDEKTVLSSLGRSNVSALVSLLSSATSPRIREKTITVICALAESSSSSSSSSCEGWLVSEGVLPPLIRLVESGSPVAREKATISLQRLSMGSPDTARMIAGHGGVRPLVEACELHNNNNNNNSSSSSSVYQAAAASTLKNLSAVPEVRQVLAEEGVVRVMVDLLDHGLLLGSKEYAAECLQNLTSSNEELRRSVISEGGVHALLTYLDGPLPQESAIGALRNLVGSVSIDVLESLGFLPRIVHVLKSGSVGAQQAAAGAICKLVVCGTTTTESTKKLVAEAGCVPLLVRMLETSKSNAAREVAAQALAGLMLVAQIRREVKRDEKSVPTLVGLLDPSPLNTAKKYAVVCLGGLSSSRKCKRLMISHGAIGYLKKLTEMDVPGAKKLLERLERGRLRSLFTRK